MPELSASATRTPKPKKSVNVQLLKPDVLAEEPYVEFDAQEVDSGIGRHNLRRRDNLRRPAHYDD